MSRECQMFTKLLADLTEAKDAVESAERSEFEARSRTTAARNHLDALQKEFDAAVADMKKEAPSQSEWGSQRLSHAGGSSGLRM
jgi:Tfp pilus assembly protein PilO